MRLTSITVIPVRALLAAVLFSSGCDVGDPADTGNGGPTDGTTDVVIDDTDNSDNGASSDTVAASTKWELWSAGHVRLRGVDIHPCALIEEGEEENEDICIRYTDQQDVRDVRDLGANLLNASYSGLFNERPPYGVHAVNQQDMDNLIEWAAEVGVYVVINMRTGPGRNEAAIQVGLGRETLFTVWTDQEAHDAWIDMWRYIAERYGDNPVIVGYDVMVEPHVNTWLDPDGDLTPEDFEREHRGTLADWNAFAQEISDAIREVDSETPIIVNALGFASASWFPALRPTTDPLTVYSLHAYDPDVYIAQDAGVMDIRYPSVVIDEGESVNFNADWIAENLQPAADFAAEHDVPIYVGEFGLYRWTPDGAAFVGDEIDLFEEMGWNYAFYVWRGDVVGFDAFNMEYGPDPDTTARVPDNTLLNTFIAEWPRSAHFPTTDQ